MNFWSGLNDLKDISSDTDSGEDVNKEENNQKKLKSNPVKDEFKLKFENLKQKNAKLKNKFANRKEKQKLKKDTLKNNRIKNDNTISAKINENINLPNTSEKTDKIIKKLEDKIDLAINESNIELAEKLSDNLFEEQTKANIIKQTEIFKFKSDVLDKRAKLDNKKTKYKWRFEAKQRWETKSNM